LALQLFVSVKNQERPRKWDLETKTRWVQTY